VLIVNFEETVHWTAVKRHA